jgi:hypothetical protein
MGKHSKRSKAQESSEKQINFERRTTENGEPNPKYVDLLDVDPPIAGQSFCLLSFLSPEKILKEKEMYYFSAFLNKWDFAKSMEKFSQFLNFVSFKYKISFEDLMKDYEEFIKDERPNLINNTLEDEYKTYLDHNEERLEKEFNVEHNFQTATRGIKFRGAFPSQAEAELRSKMLRERDPHHDIYTGECGVWMPWDPEAYKTGRVEYMEEELNALAQNKAKNEANAKTAFEQRIKETRQKAMEENIKKAEKSGNVLTQTINEDGQLVSIANMNTQERGLKEKALKASNDSKEKDKEDESNQDSHKDSDYENISVADIRNELFEGENIVVGKSDNGQSELISGPFATSK